MTTPDAPRSEERPTPTLTEVEAELRREYEDCALFASISSNPTRLRALAACFAVALDCVRAVAAMRETNMSDAELANRLRDDFPNLAHPHDDEAVLAQFPSVVQGVRDGYLPCRGCGVLSLALCQCIGDSHAR